MSVNQGAESSASLGKGEMVSEVKRDRKEREVISSEVSDWLKSAVGRVGPPGPQGPPVKHINPIQHYKAFNSQV